MFFQGGVAANKGIRAAFERELQSKIIVPEHFNVMGAIGSAILAKDYIEKTKARTNFRGLTLLTLIFQHHHLNARVVRIGARL